MRRSDGAQRLRTRYKVFLAAAGFAILGLVLLLMAQGFPKHPTLQEILRSLGSFSLATVAVALLWEYIAKEWLLDEVMERVKLSASVKRSGLLDIQVSEEEVTREVELPKSSGIQALDVLLSFDDAGHLHWHEDNAAKRMLTRAKYDGASVRVLLPDPNVSFVTGAISERLGELHRADLQVGRQLTEVARRLSVEWGTAEVGGGQPTDGFSCQIAQVREVPRYSYLRLNGQATIVACSYRKDSFSAVPVWRVKEGGALFEFFGGEFERMWEDAFPV